MGAGETEESQLRAATLISFLQKAIGYSLTGVTSEKAVFILLGKGDNGKTTLLELFEYLLDEYANLVQIDSLMLKHHDNNNAQADIADLRGARFVRTSETEQGQRLAEGKLKRITQGMGKIKAVRKYENPIEFPETHKLWIDANHRPRIKGTDNAIWNRLFLIPFDVSIAKHKQDSNLGSKLKAEAEAILAWAVHGAQRWFKEGLGKPDEVKAAVSGWRDDSQPLKEFIEDCCVLDEHRTVTISELKKTYKLWCEQERERPMKLSEFNDALEALGCTQERDESGRWWKGVGLARNDK